MANQTNTGNGDDSIRDYADTLRALLRNGVDETQSALERNLTPVIRLRTRGKVSRTVQGRRERAYTDRQSSECSGSQSGSRTPSKRSLSRSGSERNFDSRDESVRASRRRFYQEMNRLLMARKALLLAGMPAG